MDQTRRSFFRNMIAAGVAATVDVDKLLWTPGEKVYSVPPVVRVKTRATVWAERAESGSINWGIVDVFNWAKISDDPQTRQLFHEAVAQLNALPPGAPRVVSSWGTV